MDRKTPQRDWLRRSIAIRKRTLNETRDLALRVAVKKLPTLLFYYALLAVPVYFVNLALWALWFPWEDVIEPQFGRVSVYHWSFLFPSVVWLTVSLETAFIGSLVSQYLGIWLFSPDEREIHWKFVVRSWRERWFQLIYYLILTRPIRLRRFYVETILLERAPFRGDGKRISTRKRVANMNSGYGGSGFFELLCTESYLICGVISGLLLIGSIVNSFVPDEVPKIVLLDFLFFPVFIFGCKLYNVVYNFFSYINYRIASEGWDIDLAFKTQARELVALDRSEDETIPKRFRRGRTLGSLSLDPESENQTIRGEAAEVGA